MVREEKGLTSPSPSSARTLVTGRRARTTSLRESGTAPSLVRFPDADPSESSAKQRARTGAPARRCAAPGRYTRRASAPSSAAALILLKRLLSSVVQEPESPRTRQRPHWARLVRAWPTRTTKALAADARARLEVEHCMGMGLAMHRSVLQAPLGPHSATMAQQHGGDTTTAHPPGVRPSSSRRRAVTIVKAGPWLAAHCGTSPAAASAPPTSSASGKGHGWLRGKRGPGASGAPTRHVLAPAHRAGAGQASAAQPGLDPLPSTSRPTSTLTPPLSMPFVSSPAPRAGLAPAQARSQR